MESEFTSVAKKFNEVAYSLIDKLEERVVNEVDAANVDRLRKRLNALFRETGDDTAAIAEGYAVLLEFNDRIQRRDESFFTTIDYRAEYVARTGKQITRDNEFLFSVIDAAKSVYTGSPPHIKDYVYNRVRALAAAAIDWSILLKKKEIARLAAAAK